MKRLLIVGSKSHIAKHFMKHSAVDYEFIKLQRGDGGDLDADLTRPDQILSLPSGKDFPELNGILFFQGIKPMNSPMDSDWDRMQDMMALNLSAPIYIMKKFRPFLKVGSCVLFFSSVAADKGSYDPSYAAAKSGIRGLMLSFANYFSDIRFNSIKLGLVEGTPVDLGMTEDFRQKHRNRMFGNELIDPDEVSKTIRWILNNQHINCSEIPLTG